MTSHSSRPAALTWFLGPALGAFLTVSFLAPVQVQAGHYEQTNLVSNVPGLAKFTDPNLRNPWGVSFNPTGPFWVSNQVTNTSTLYDSDGTPRPLVVNIPTTSSGPQGPTGQVFNGTSDFILPTGGRALFLFANLNGTISGWNPAQGTAAPVMASASSAIYTGLALGNNGSGNFLYAANALSNTIDVYDGSFAGVTLGGPFTDPNLPAGFTVYNVQQLGSSLFVTYNNQSDGGGVINEFDLDGNFLRRVASNAAGGPLDAPWGLAIAPHSFGPFGGALLVGNVHDGRISAFDLATGSFLGQLLDANGNPIANTGLWGLTFRSVGKTGEEVLYFAAGINGERDGLFGTLRFVPEPSSIVLGAIAAGLLGLQSAIRRRAGR